MTAVTGLPGSALPDPLLGQRHAPRWHFLRNDGGIRLNGVFEIEASASLARIIPKQLPPAVWPSSGFDSKRIMVGVAEAIEDMERAVLVFVAPAAQIAKLQKDNSDSGCVARPWKSI
jgi:hypothetical protein